MRNRKNLIFHTFIGLKVAIVRSAHRDLIGLSGKIINETKNLIVIETDGTRGVSSHVEDTKRGKKEVKIPKAASTFRFFLDNNESIDIDGSEVAFRPEERAKKLI